MTQAQTSQRTQDPARVVRRRVTAGLEQKELAALVGISAAQLCRIEKGHCGTSVKTLRRIAEALNCEIADLIPPIEASRGAA